MNRWNNLITQDMREIQLDLEELKQSQRVGNSQIKIKHFVSDAITISTVPNSYNEYMTAIGKAYVRAVAPDVLSPNALIAYCIPYATYNGTVISPSGTYMSAKIWQPSATLTNSQIFNLYVFDISPDGNALSSKSIQVRFHIWASAELTLTVGSGNVTS